MPYNTDMVHWSKGPLADQTKAKLRARKISEETRAKLKARVFTPEWRKKLSEAKKGKIDSSETILVRMHHLNIIADCLQEQQNPRSGLLFKALKKINKAQKGVLVIIRQPYEKISDLIFQNQSSAIESQKTLRNYGTGAQILADLGVKNLTLLSNSKKSVIGLDAFGIKICGYKKI